MSIDFLSKKYTVPPFPLACLPISIEQLNIPADVENLAPFQNLSPDWSIVQPNGGPVLHEGVATPDYIADLTAVATFFCGVPYVVVYLSYYYKINVYKYTVDWLNFATS